MANDIVKSVEDRKKALEERRKINEEKRKQEMERLEQDIRDGQFGINVFYPDYLQRRNRNNQQDDKYRLEHEVMEMCATCGCNIF